MIGQWSHLKYFDTVIYKVDDFKVCFSCCIGNVLLGVLVKELLRKSINIRSSYDLWLTLLFESPGTQF